MSASEKLKELDEAMTPFAFVERESGEEAVAIPLANYRYFQRILPQIMALAEAAELVVGTQPRGDFDIHTLHQALEDLYEALS